MTKTKRLLMLGVVAIAAVLSMAFRLTPAYRYEFTNCSSSGSASQAIAAGSYLFRVRDEPVWLCWAATCTGSDGEWFNTGFAMILDFNAETTLSCRSAGSTGDAIITKGMHQ